MRLSLASSTLLALLSLPFAACIDIPEQPGSGVEIMDKEGLTAAIPVDVAVLPVINASEVSNVPLADLRRGFQQALVRRRYSPLSIEYVDSQLTEASYGPGTLQEDAWLQVQVDSWDWSLWEDVRAVSAAVSVRLVKDPENLEGPALWSGRLFKRYDLPRQTIESGKEPILRARLCELIGNEILAALPARKSTL